MRGAEVGCARGPNEVPIAATPARKERLFIARSPRRPMEVQPCYACPRDLNSASKQPVVAGQGPWSPAVATRPARLHLSLLRDDQRVYGLDAKVSDGALSDLK